MPKFKETIQKFSETIFDVINKKHEQEMQLEAAKSQITGWKAAKNGESLIELADSMGLKHEELMQIQEDLEADLTPEEYIDLEQHLYNEVNQ